MDKPNNTELIPVKGNTEPSAGIDSSLCIWSDRCTSISWVRGLQETKRRKRTVAALLTTLFRHHLLWNYLIKFSYSILSCLPEGVRRVGNHLLPRNCISSKTGGWRSKIQVVRVQIASSRFIEFDLEGYIELSGVVYSTFNSNVTICGHIWVDFV